MLRRRALPLVVLATVLAGCAGGETGPVYHAPLAIEADLAASAAAPPAVVPPKVTPAGTKRAVRKVRAAGIVRRMPGSCRSRLARTEAADGRRIDELRGIERQVSSTR